MFGKGDRAATGREMAIFRLEAKVFSREKRGRSVIAAAAYRAGTKLKDEIRDKIFDYARRTKGVIQSDILAPEGAPGWAHDPGQLWNKVEAGEKRVDAQLAREFILAVPPELSADAQFQTAVDWAKKELVTSGMIAEVSLHHTKSGKNPHVHILCTMRKLDGERFSPKKPREWNDVALLVKQRESWAVYNLIMKDKERLLSLDEPLRFIFSHSALREGWDSPNVFQICTLNETKSVTKKRQEIGRGLRLPVNQDGERIFDENINKLLVVANESYGPARKNGHR